MPLNDEQTQKRNVEADGNPLVRFCALEYVRQDSCRVSPILLVLEDANGSLRFLVRPDWCSIVKPEDVKYLDSLLEDFRERAIEQPAPLFKQLSSLGVGPLVTQETGQQISDHPHLLELFSRFVQV
jgi:hypothetical protein